ncbi:S-adenosylhomocysteine nucleosidase [Granulibacter bethesdensis]|nr:S-adenosylhomocysteine nucleosidase [Granulibacter bethesdensis]
MMKTGVVVGLQAEARLLCGFGIAAVGGGEPEGAEQAAVHLAESGVDRLVSFGLAGGLDPAILPGALLIPAELIEEGKVYRTDPLWPGGMTLQRMVATRQIVVSRKDKAALFHQTGAGAVDLESGAVARVAARYGIPFSIVRAVCDPADRDLPPAALLALDQAGAIGVFRVAGSILRQPSQIGSLMALARDAAVARRTLRRFQWPKQG